MTFLSLIEALAANITPTNMGDAVALVEKLISLGETIASQASSSSSQPK